jgi:hypothetical protein
VLAVGELAVKCERLWIIIIISLWKDSVTTPGTPIRREENYTSQTISLSGMPDYLREDVALEEEREICEALTCAVGKGSDM